MNAEHQLERIAGAARVAFFIRAKTAGVSAVRHECAAGEGRGDLRQLSGRRSVVAATPGVDTRLATARVF
jgi:hypothetical protein